MAVGVLVAGPDYHRLGDLFRAEDDGPAYRCSSPLVIAPVESITDQQGVPWMVVGPTSDAHFDKDAGGRELAGLLEHKSCRQNEIDQHQEWRDALASLKHRLQQYQTEYPRGWFSDRRQKLEILASAWTRRANRSIDLRRTRLSWKARRKRFGGRSRRSRNPAARRNGIATAWSNSTAVTAVAWLPGKATWISPGTAPGKAGFGRNR